MTRPPQDERAAWPPYWRALGQTWRTDPEISPERQEFLAARRAVVPNLASATFPFRGIALARADVEWLLATHEEHRGPVDWEDVAQRQRVGLDLRGADLRNTDAGVVNLSGLPLARLRAGLTAEEWANASTEQKYDATARMDEVNLREAHLEGAVLRAVSLIGAYVRRAHLEESDLTYAILSSADVEDAYLDGAVLVRVRLQGTYISGASLRGVNLQSAHAEGADLRAAHLEQAQLAWAHFEGANLDGAILYHARLNDTEELAEGSRHILSGTYLEGAKLDGVYAQGADLRAAHLDAASLIQAHLEGAGLRGAHLAGANLSGSFCAGANFEQAHLDGANFSDARGEQADPSEAHLEGARLDNAVLEGACLRGVFLAGATLRGAALARADLRGAQVDAMRMPEDALLRIRPWSADFPDTLPATDFTDAVFDETTATYDRPRPEGRRATVIHGIVE